MQQPITLNTFQQNLFGAISGQSAGLIQAAPNFIPINGSGGTLNLTSQTACWLGLQTRQMQYWAYRYCAPLASVIDKLAECDINGVPEIHKIDGSEDFSQSPKGLRLMRLLRQPNPRQTWEQFRGQQVIYKKIFGYVPVWPIMPVGITDKTYAYSLWNIPPWLATPQFNYDFNYYSRTGTPVLRFQVSIYGKSFEIPGDELMMLYDGFVQDSQTQYQLPVSKVAGLDYAISNCCYSQEADNVLLRRQGPLTIISHDPPTDGIKGYIPMSPEGKIELQESLNKYGVTFEQFQHYITRTPVKVQHSGFDAKELMTKETFKQGIETICDRFGVPTELMGFKDSKYNDRVAEEKGMYQNNIIPNNMRDLRVYNQFFLDDAAIKLVCDFNELPIMQEDATAAATALNIKTDALLKQYKEDFIMKNAVLEGLGQNSIEGGDVFYSETEAGKAAVAQANKIANSSMANVK